MPNCEARQYSDQMQCARCGLAWDVNDPDPPPCGPQVMIPPCLGRQVLDRLLAEFAQPD